MSKNIPWGVNRLRNMFPQSGQVQTQRNGRWVRAVATPYRKSTFEALRAAWWVFTGKAEAVVWPDAGDLEDAIDPRNMGKPT